VPQRFRPRLEALEERMLPSTYYAATASDLINDINAANKAGGANTIVLTAPTTSPYVLTVVNNTTNGKNGLPVISGGGKNVAADNLTILGNGDTIERGQGTTPAFFRLFDVASGASLTLLNLTLQNGFAGGYGAAADGGAIYNQGTLTLNGVAVQNNLAGGANGANGVETNKLSKGQSITGQAGADAAGGGIWSSGSLTLEGGTTLQGNTAVGGRGGQGGYYVSPQIVVGNGGAGGNGLGGGLFVAGGSVHLTNANLNSNKAYGGTGGHAGWAGSRFAGAPAVGGNGLGGGLYIAAGSVTLSSDAVLSNLAVGGEGGLTANNTSYAQGGNGLGGGLYVAGGTLTMTNDTVTGNDAVGVEGGVGEGGGLYILPTASVCLDTATLYAIANNLASTSDSNIHGSYSLC
jgi:hypothetical protein